MANWSNFKLTKKGQALYAKLGAGTAKALTFTKAKLGNGSLSDVFSANDLAVPKMDVGIDTKTVTSAGTTRLHCIIANDLLRNGFYIKELGVFAMDPDVGEILMYYATDSQPDYLPPESATAVAQKFNIDLAISGQTTVDVSFNHIELIREMINIAYPIGSIYISSQDKSPGILFGVGTWVQIKDRMILAAGTTYTNGATDGSNGFELLEANMPAHTHNLSITAAGEHVHTAVLAPAGGHGHGATIASAGAHTHTRGTMEIKGTFDGNTNDGTAAKTGAFYRTETKFSGSDGNKGGGVIGFAASRAWTGATSSAGAHTHSATIATAAAHTHNITIDNTPAHTHAITVAASGNGAKVNYMPPYIVKYIWERTA